MSIDKMWLMNEGLADTSENKTEHVQTLLPPANAATL